MIDYKSFLNSMVRHPGVYRMLDKQGRVLYIGKAKDLRQRLSYYFNSRLTVRLQRMLSQTVAIETTVTNTETEALLLENNLIKTLHPRYNILLRDDKTYPYIYLTTQHSFPNLTLYRGAKRREGRYFGPYPSANTAREALHLLQGLFPVRQCEETWYRNRTRPCLQYQLKHCSAPCVGLITPEKYAEEVAHSILFLEGRTNQVTEILSSRMNTAAKQLEFEEAARLRNKIAVLQRIQGRQHISGEFGDLDIIAAATQEAIACIQVFCVREGRIINNTTFFPRLPTGENHAAVISAFLAQYYLGHPVPTEILVTHQPTDTAVLEDALSCQSGRPVTIHSQPRGERSHWLLLASNNAQHGLEARLASQSSFIEKLTALGVSLAMNTTPQRLECFDISHTSGERPVAACVVFDQTGPKLTDYRRFNIEGITSGDDYAALTQALTRRYQRILNGEAPLPDILCIDGGRGQLATAENLLQSLGIQGVMLLGIAKGENRKPGLEQIWVSGQEQPLNLPPHAPALHLLQQLRDEAHRFALTGHRQRRAKARRISTLETIPGIGPKRRQRLLQQFGGLKGLIGAGIEDIANVTGIGKTLAQQLYDVLHSKSWYS